MGVSGGRLQILDGPHPTQTLMSTASSFMYQDGWNMAAYNLDTGDVHAWAGMITHSSDNLGPFTVGLGDQCLFGGAYYASKL